MPGGCLTSFVLSTSPIPSSFQAGGKAYSEIIFFEDKRALDEFKTGTFEFSAGVSAIAITAGASASAGTTGATSGASGAAGRPPRSREQTMLLFVEILHFFIRDTIRVEERTNDTFQTRSFDKGSCAALCCGICWSSSAAAIHEWAHDPGAERRLIRISAKGSDTASSAAR
jgi:hypothetical protein